jgi:hypothetical protein
MKENMQYMLPDETNKITIGDAQVTYLQERDCCQKGDDFQELKIKIEDGGGGPYVILKTTRWAISNLDELIGVLNDFMQKTQIKNKRKKINV